MKRLPRSTVLESASWPVPTSAKASAPRLWTRTGIRTGNRRHWLTCFQDKWTGSLNRWWAESWTCTRNFHPRRWTMPEKGTVAFLGLGHMGGPMAVNLVRAGYAVVGFDVVPAAVQTAREHGVTVAASAAGAVAGADVVLTMFPSGGHVLDAYRGNAGQPGLLAAAPPGTMFLDCSTINVDEAREAARLAGEAGHRSIDAPVSGGVVGAEAGTLTFMAGGQAEDFESVRPLLEVMGKRVVHCGGHGAGQAAKICNNLILGVSMIAVSEAFVLGEKLGLSHQALFDVASASSGQCWSLTSYCP